MFISQWTTWVDAVFVHISHEINNQQCLGKYGLSFIHLFLLNSFGFFACIFAIPTQTHKSYGWYFSVSCQISAKPKLGHYSFSVHFFAQSVSQNKPKKTKTIVLSLKCWQLNPKIYPKDFIDFWFNCARLLNHVKVMLSKPFTRGMKSVVNKIIGPMPLLCQCLPFFFFFFFLFAVWLLQGSNSIWLEWTVSLPHI